MHRCPLLLASAAGLFVAAEKWTWGRSRGSSPRVPIGSSSSSAASCRSSIDHRFAVHGVQFDPATRKVYVTDRSSHRIEVFDENGKFLDQFSTGNPSTLQVLFLAADKNFWIADNTTSKIVKFDIGGHYQYSWGSQVSGPAPCGMCTG